MSATLQGTPYEWGGDSPEDGFDCSGLVQYVYRAAGVKIPRTAIEQYRKLPQVDPRAIQTGDLLFWDTGLNHRKDNRLPDGSFVSHVSIYTGNGKMRHASVKRGVIEVDAGEYAKKFQFIGARRALGAKPKK